VLLRWEKSEQRFPPDDLRPEHVPQKRIDLRGCFDLHVVVFGTRIVFAGDAGGLAVIMPDLQPAFVDLMVDQMGLHRAAEVSRIEGVHVELGIEAAQLGHKQKAVATTEI